MENRRKATLHLENGMRFEGYSFGYEQVVSGETVYSTAMVGYPELLTDPTNSGQILCLTYPLIGNYGVPSDELTKEGISAKLESDRIHPNGLVAFDYCEDFSNWEAVKSLEQWMLEQKVTGILGLDTRELTKVLREIGSMMGVIVPESCKFEAKMLAKDDFKQKNHPSAVSVSSPVVYQGTGKKVVVVDCGVKHSFIRDLQNRGLEVIRVPFDYDYTSMEYDGVFVSNGPGNPEDCQASIDILKKAMSTGKPIFGINLGYLLLAKAAGCTTMKLKRAHRSANQPVRKVGTNRTYITNQNTAYTIVESSLPTDWSVCFTNLNDGAVDGIRHKSKAFYGCQFDPKQCIGLNEPSSLFDEFISKL